MRRLVFAVATIAILGITACASDESTPTVEGLLAVDPAEVVAGGTVEATFSGDLATDRGGYFFLNNSSGEPVAVLWTDKDEERGGAGSSTEIDETVILAYAIVDPGADTLVLPLDLPPGSYQLCTANSIPRTCTEIVIVTS